MTGKMTARSVAVMGMVLAFLSGIFWGFSGNCAQFLCSVKGVPTQWVTSLRMLVSGALLLIPYIAVKRKDALSIFCTRRSALRVIAFSFLGLLLSMFSYIEAIKYTDAGTATILQYIGPVFVLVFVCFREKRHPLRREILAAVLALLGIFLVATGGDVSSLRISVSGFVWGMISALGLVFYTMIPAQNSQKDMLPLLGYGLIIGGTVFFIITGAWHMKVEVDGGVLLGLAGMVVPGTVLGYGLYLEAVALAGPVKTSIIACVEPFAAAIFSYFWFGTDLGWVKIIAAVLMTAAVVLMSVKNKREAIR